MIDQSDSQRATTVAAPRVLVVEDDRRLGALLERGLQEEGFVVVVVADGVAGLAAAVGGGFDVVVVDGMLPGLDGFDLVTQARAADLTAPVLLLTARDAVPDRVAGLDAGADDYLVKPFAFAELLARLRALLRRNSNKKKSGLMAWRDLEVRPEKREVRRAGAVIALSARQFGLLEVLVRLRGEVATREVLLEEVFGYRFDPGTNLIDVHVSHLRQKLDVAGQASLIETVRGVGYRMADAP